MHAGSLMRDVAGLEIWLPRGYLFQAHCISWVSKHFTRSGYKQLLFFYSQECRLQAIPSCNQGNQFQVIKVWLFPGTEAMCAREKWGQGMG